MNNIMQQNIPTGKGIGIAILDTGISPVADFTKPYNRIAVFRDFVNGRTEPYDDNGHGTHVTGIACGNGFLSNGKYCGVASDAHIIALKILDFQGQGISYKAVQAMRWIMDNATKYNIKVVNLSIGTNDRKVHQPLANAVETLWNAGITVVAAAANPEGNHRFCPPPSLSPKILCVGAWEDKSYFLPPKGFAKFTNTHSTLPDIWTYGENIISVLSPDYNFALPNRSTAKIIEKNYIYMSGASMATPAISGIAACILEKNPNLTPTQIKKQLCHTAALQDGLLVYPDCLTERKE